MEGALSHTHTFSEKGEGGGSSLSLTPFFSEGERGGLSLSHTFSEKGTGGGSSLSLTHPALSLTLCQRKVREGAPLSLSLSLIHCFREGHHTQHHKLCEDVAPLVLSLSHTHTLFQRRVRGEVASLSLSLAHFVREG